MALFALRSHLNNGLNSSIIDVFSPLSDMFECIGFISSKYQLDECESALFINRSN